jgi:hypothetical protein
MITPTRTYSFRPAVCPEQGDEHLVTIRDGAEVKRYWVRELPCQTQGLRFRWSTARTDGYNVYRVWISPDPEKGGHTCTCRGYCRWGHCRHIECSVRLLEHGRI